MACHTRMSLENKNTYDNYAILLHPGMESDPEIVKRVSSWRAQLE